VVVHSIGGGSVSFQALAWLDGIGANLVHLSWDGEVLATSGRPGADDPGLRRALALATESPAGIAISKHLIGAKLSGQASLIERKVNRGSEQAAEIRRQVAALESAETLMQIRLVESRAAVAYWRAWASVSTQFGKSSLDVVPEHWWTFGSRTSPLTPGPRLAATPGNALMNYLYAIGEAEARIALHAVGLDPGLGILHADVRCRDSLALDLLEAIRPAIDEYVFDQIATRTFSHKDFVELPNGNCRLSRPIVAALAETAPVWASALGPYAEHIARILGKLSKSVRRVPTPLTQANRSAGRGTVRNLRATPKRKTPNRLPDACRSCGIIFEAASRDRDLCDECLLDSRRSRVGTFQAAGAAAIERAVAEGRHVSSNAAAKAKLGRANAARIAQAIAWNREHRDTADPEGFRREILPSLLDVPLRRLMAATGLSNAYCSQIRRGLVTPHPRHWEGLLIFRSIGAVKRVNAG
jgi:CRISPR-associated endonuclease Cas1